MDSRIHSFVVVQGPDEERGTFDGETDFQGRRFIGIRVHWLLPEDCRASDVRSRSVSLELFELTECG